MNHPQLRIVNDVLHVNGKLDFDTVADLSQRGNEYIREASSSLTIDLQNIDSCNSAGLAVLLEWLRTAQQQQCQIIFKNPSTQLTAIAQVCGLSSLLATNNTVN